MAIRVLFSLFLALAALSCGKSPPVAERQRPLVLVSLGPYQGLVEKIGGDLIEVQPVVPSDTNPHVFEPTARQVAAIAQGEVWFRIGEPFETKVLSALRKKNPGLVVSDLRDKVPLIEEHEHHHCPSCEVDPLDRHIWLSPKLALIQAEAMEKVLEEAFPQHRETFKQNLEALRQELTVLDEEIRTLLEPVKDRVLLVSHPAFAYFCQDYQFEQLSVEYEGKDPRPKHLEETLGRAMNERARFALALPQYNNKGVQRIADKLHLPAHWIDPYSPDYFEMMRNLAELIAHPQNTP